ncbi:MAG: DUF309 domain-containing protein [Cyanobacteria bacterium P01_C01_bin.73]
MASSTVYPSSPNPLPDDFWRGVEQFNQGEFYPCHDTLEAIWMEAETPIKPFYQGILQIAVAFYHLGNRNWQGAAILLGEGINRLCAFEPVYEGVDVENLIDQAESWLKLLQNVGPEGVEPLAEAIANTDLSKIEPEIEPALLSAISLPNIRTVDPSH